MSPVDIDVGPADGMPERQTAFEILPTGELRVTHAGRRSTGERNLEEVASLVVILLNEWGEGWAKPHRPTGPESGADMIAEGPRGILRLQVTRVPHNEEHWKIVNADRMAKRVATPDALATDLIEAIRRKAARYSPAVRSTTMLVLDGQTGIYDLPPVLHAFTATKLAEAQAMGFDDIFLLGQVRFVNLLRPQCDTTWFSCPTDADADQRE